MLLQERVALMPVCRVSGSAQRTDFALSVEFVDPFGKFVYRNLIAPDITDLVVDRLANIENKDLPQRPGDALRFLWLYTSGADRSSCFKSLPFGFPQN